MPRVYVRKFDHDEARRRHAAGEAVASLAREFGVSLNRVYQVVNREYGARALAYTARYNKSGKCVDCGAAVSIYTTGKTGRQEKRCMDCSARVRATTVREDELLCGNCREWKPDVEFPFNRPLKHRRGRHDNCRRCQTVLKARYYESRKIPCVQCGSPRLPHNLGAGARGTTDTGLCLSCYRASIRKKAAA